MSLNKIASLIDQIMVQHNVYTTVTLRPHYQKDGRTYNGVGYEVYISKMPSGENFTRGLTESGAIEILTNYLNGIPKAHFNKARLKRIKELSETKSEIEEEIAELRNCNDKD